MVQSLIALIVAIVALIVALLGLYLINKKKVDPADNFSGKSLQLQAYERLVLLSERIAIPSVVSRCNQLGVDARQMQLLLLDNIKQEYEYNTSQQVYVSHDAWAAVRKLKDQNMLLINQVGSSMPKGAGGIDLNKQLLEVLMNHKIANLHELVLEGLNAEAQKVLAN